MVNHSEFIKPGAGISVEQVRLAPIRSELSTGQYNIDEYDQQIIRNALDDPNLPLENVRAALNTPNNKGFRNAYTSIVMERVWPEYEQVVSSGQSYEINFEDDQTSLATISTDKNQAAHSMAEIIARTNQDVPTHLICELFRDGQIPKISGDPAKDQQYFNAFREQTELLTTRTDSFFPTVPEKFGAPTRFIASGLLVLRTHVFGVPNLIDGVASQQGIELNPRQHRNGFSTSLTKSIAHYYLPTGPVTIAVNSQLIDSELRLRSDRWTSNGDPDNFIVYPHPHIVQAANDKSKNQPLPAQTNCPAFHSRIETADGQATLPLPRSLAALALGQLDDSYYPLRQKEFDRKPKTFYIDNPDWAVSPRATLAPSFPNGLFIADDYQKPVLETSIASHDTQLTEREQIIFNGLGKGRNTASFSSFMSQAASEIARQELNGATPDDKCTNLQRFYRRLLVDTDAAFDANREKFATLANDPEAFSNALHTTPITRLGESLTITFDEALQIFRKVINDSSIYTTHAQSIIKDSTEKFWKIGVMGMSRTESIDQSARQIQQIKETTNGLYAGVLFDIAYGNYVSNPGYYQARDRYIATKLAYQYNDEILDVITDHEEGSTNLINALAQENGEFNSILEAADQLTALLPPEGLDLKSPDTINSYCNLLRHLAPNSYNMVSARQETLLDQADASQEIRRIIAIPFNRNTL